MQPHATITIDGTTVQAAVGANLLQVARENGFDIPGLCYHKKLSPTGACRLCMVKVAGIKGLVMSCTLQVAEGLKITAFDEDLELARKQTLEYLLCEHNEERDGTYHDEFRDLVMRYDLDDLKKRSYPKIIDQLGYGRDDSSPVLSYDAAKCIKCFRCIKACAEVQGKNVLSFSDRGVTSHIVAGLNHWASSECDGCGECIQLCPTGALVEKPHRQEIDLAKIEKRVQTTCPYCGVGCQLELLVQDDRIVRSNGVEGVSPNDGRLCVKGRFGYDFVHHKDRLTTPLIKKNGKFVRASWDEALALIADRFTSIKAAHGSQALAGYASAKCTNEENYIFQKFIRIAFGNNNVDYCTRLCHASTVTAMLRSIGNGAGSNSIEDFAKTDCLFITGNNIIDTHPVTATFVKNGRAKGQKIIVCDPKWTPMVKYADIWLQPRLGTDVALLNGMIRVILQEGLIDENFIAARVEGGMQDLSLLQQCVDPYTPQEVEKITAVPQDKMAAAARLYAGAATAIIATGMGMSQQVVGTNNVYALINMMLICGQIGKMHAGINPPRGQNNVQGATDVGCSPLFYPGYLPISDQVNRKRIAALWGVEEGDLCSQPGLTTVEIMHGAYKGHIRGMYIMGENPMITDPDLNHTQKAIERLDFLVVQDIFPTETTQYADVILPATSFAEKDGSFVNSDRRVARVRRAVSPPGEAWQDWQIIIRIAEQMKYHIGSYRDSAAIFDEIAQAAPMMSGITHKRMGNKGVQWPCPTKDHPGTSTLFLDRFNTATGRARLHPVPFVLQSEQTSAKYPFILNSGRLLYQYHSATMSRRNSSLNDFVNGAYLLINENDAEKIGLQEGDAVRVTSARGELRTVVKRSREVAEGELFMPWHFSEAQVNRLTRGELDPDSKIAPFKYSACRVDRI
ncbi:MAG: formate dehydrogenase subunit alpha [Desulforhopalus sp.]